jgi:hypothetical protein
MAIGSGLLWSAYQRNAGDGVPSPTTLDGNTILMGCSSIFTSCEEFDPTLWYAAGTGLMLAAAGSLAVAARLRARA